MKNLLPQNNNMKTKILNIIGVLLVVCGFVACSEDNSGSMDVNGDCRVQKFVLNDEYEGAIDIPNRLIKVKVPVDFSTKNDMVVTSLTIPAGAKSNINVGDHLNMESDKNIHITSGSLVMDYRLAVRMVVAMWMPYHRGSKPAVTIV